jgi:hypothetical protein
MQLSAGNGKNLSNKCLGDCGGAAEVAHRKVSTPAAQWLAVVDLRTFAEDVAAIASIHKSMSFPHNTALCA